MIAMLRRLLRLSGLPRARVALSVALGVLAAAFAVALMTTAGYLISRAAEQPPILTLTVTIVAVRFFGIARPIARYGERLASHDLALHALGRVRVGFWSRVEPLAPAQLSAYREGDLLGRMVGDVDGLQGLYLRGIGPPVVALLLGTLCVGAVALALPAAALVLGAGLLLAIFAVPLLAAALGRAGGRRRAAARGELTARLVETLRGAPELVAYGREDDAQARVRGADGELARLARRDALAGGAAGALTVLVAGLTVAGVLAVAVSAHQADALDRVLIATLALLALSSFEPAAGLPGVARDLMATLGAGHRVLEVIDADAVVSDPIDPLPPPPRWAPVTLEGVSVRYAPGEDQVLQRLDLRLDPGRRVALVGPSGAGKTTVVRLLERFIDPLEGRVTIAGHDVREYRQEDVRAMFALAGQDIHVFHSTIRENLRLARPAASDADLRGALQRAQLDGWVASLPDGLDTFVGEEGAWLSGGQRQRLLIARALLSDAPVLVLDEPTAHLDGPTARDLMTDVLDVAVDRAVLLITHRTEGLDRMDEIVELRSV